MDIMPISDRNIIKFDLELRLIIDALSLEVDELEKLANVSTKDAESMERNSDAIS